MSKIRLFVREGALPLLDDESIDAFREALVTALREDYGSRGLIGFDDAGERMGWLWLVEVYDAATIVEVTPAQIDGQPYVPTFYERVPFTRAPDGTFTLGAPVRVRRKIEWEPIEDAEDSVDIEEAIEVHDREREIRSEITTETIRGVRFPVGDPSGVENALFRLKYEMEWPRTAPTPAERGQIQSIVDRTNRIAGSNLRA